MNLYETLDVAMTATSAEIKKAYRRLAQKSHPDRGGDAEAFHQIQTAYDVLSDESRRAHYDKTGDDTQSPNLSSIAFEKVAELFASIIADKTSGNIIDRCRNLIDQKQQQATKASQSAEKETAKLLKLLNRVINKNGGENIFSMVLQAKIDHLAADIERAKSEIELLSKMKALVDEHEDTAPEIIQESRPFFSPEEMFRSQFGGRFGGI
jgi:curved DNA-binding protein CbpA